MNIKIILKTLGGLLICEGLAMIPSLIVSIIYQDGATNAFAYSIFFLCIFGVVFGTTRPTRKTFYSRDGFALVAFGWIFVSLFGALPFYLSGVIPSFVDCFFEACSGFSTTGASILNQIEGMPESILFWRSFTHWLGGMGVLVLALAVLPKLAEGAFQIMKAESPGPTPSKIVPRLRDTAKILYTIYLGITVVEIILLWFAGMPLLDSMIHSFGTLGTGGFSSKNLSIGAYNSPIIEIIITIFMLGSGVNFALYYQLLKQNYKDFIRDEELRMYLRVVLVAIAVIALDLYVNDFYPFLESVRHTAFQVASVITTTGYATVDFDLWPMFSKMVLFLLMFIGASAGSTGGGIKNIRILIMIRAAKQEILRVLHPRGIYRVRYNGKSLEDRTLYEIIIFFVIYMILFTMAALVISLNGFDFVTTISSVAATLNNIGPGFNMVGATGNYSAFSDLSKIVLSICMITGRLELYPMLLLLIPSFWKKVNI